jgi:hypothetical protein
MGDGGGGGGGGGYRTIINNINNNNNIIDMIVESYKFIIDIHNFFEKNNTLTNEIIISLFNFLLFIIDVMMTFLIYEEC